MVSEETKMKVNHIERLVQAANEAGIETFIEKSHEDLWSTDCTFFD